MLVTGAGGDCSSRTLRMSLLLPQSFPHLALGFGPRVSVVHVYKILLQEKKKDSRAVKLGTGPFLSHGGEYKKY